MTITNTITGTEITTHHTNRKWAETYIAQEVIWMNEEEAEKPKEERHYYTSLDFKITD
jgi:hypothetical protein